MRSRSLSSIGRGCTRREPPSAVCRRTGVDTYRCRDRHCIPPVVTVSYFAATTPLGVNGRGMQRAEAAAPPPRPAPRAALTARPAPPPPPRPRRRIPQRGRERLRKRRIPFIAARDAAARAPHSWSLSCAQLPCRVFQERRNAVFDIPSSVTPHYSANVTAARCEFRRPLTRLSLRLAVCYWNESINWRNLVHTLALKVDSCDNAFPSHEIRF